MGGHGGLNILPQKSWNVYGRDNRERVARDEAKHAAELQAEEAKELQAQRDKRREKLLARAQGVPELPEGPAGMPGRQEDQADASTVVAIGHVNFWQEDEVKAGAQDWRAEAVKAEETKKRGDPSRQTSDARFDASFQLAHGLQCAASSAWYVRPTVASSGHGMGSSPPQHLGSIAYIDLGAKSKSKDRKDKSSKSHKKYWKHKKEKGEQRRSRKDEGGHRYDAALARESSGATKKSVEVLREERVAREALERRRALQAQVGRPA
eukprot:CAMPEP_0117655072 /NCGR_PEP_ID=MMETSP0804-20121206/4083_1 /TAXON_ID=1074897 /ORGANISM="Tetraselmis astigmatica, Strain CCMP880" /LENGTH=264 /DNA_ID=CAMNT_0005461397 /DNA_START=423 /DNA_END=1217 /DNA_ORIENTATION=+